MYPMDRLLDCLEEQEMKMNNRYAKSLLVKHLIAACSILIVGAVCTVVFKEWAFIAGAALIGLYFAAEALSVFFNDKNGRYYMVNAIVVSCEEGKDLLNNAQLTYRMIPVDEDGEYIIEHLRTIAAHFEE